MTTHGILTGPAIRKAIDEGEIWIAPYDSALVNPASVDVRLGDTFATYRKWVGEHDGSAEGLSGRYNLHRRDGIIDAKEIPEVEVRTIPSAGIVLQPGVLYLMHTLETITTDRYAPVLDGKSSVGRLGVYIHVTAGYGDPGFDGQYTLEVHVIHPVRLYAGMRIGQMRFHTLAGPLELYTEKGNYVGAASKGPVASKLYKQFEGKK